MPKGKKIKQKETKEEKKAVEPSPVGQDNYVDKLTKLNRGGVGTHLIDLSVNRDPSVRGRHGLILDAATAPNGVPAGSTVVVDHVLAFVTCHETGAQGESSARLGLLEKLVQGVFKTAPGLPPARDVGFYVENTLKCYQYHAKSTDVPASWGDDAALRARVRDWEKAEVGDETLVKWAAGSHEKEITHRVNALLTLHHYALAVPGWITGVPTVLAAPRILGQINYACWNHGYFLTADETAAAAGLGANCVLAFGLDKLCLVASRHINPGEELTFDPRPFADVDDPAVDPEFFGMHTLLAKEWGDERVQLGETEEFAIDTRCKCAACLQGGSLILEREHHAVWRKFTIELPPNTAGVFELLHGCMGPMVPFDEETSETPQKVTDSWVDKVELLVERLTSAMDGVKEIGKHGDVVSITTSVVRLMLAHVAVLEHVTGAYVLSRAGCLTVREATFALRVLSLGDNLTVPTANVSIRRKLVRQMMLYVSQATLMGLSPTGKREEVSPVSDEAAGRLCEISREWLWLIGGIPPVVTTYDLSLLDKPRCTILNHWFVCALRLCQTSTEDPAGLWEELVSKPYAETNMETVKDRVARKPAAVPEKVSPRAPVDDLAMGVLSTPGALSLESLQDALLAVHTTDVGDGMLVPAERTTASPENKPTTTPFPFDLESMTKKGLEDALAPGFLLRVTEKGKPNRMLIFDTNAVAWQLAPAFCKEVAAHNPTMFVSVQTVDVSAVKENKGKSKRNKKKKKQPEASGFAGVVPTSAAGATVKSGGSHAWVK